VEDPEKVKNLKVQLRFEPMIFWNCRSEGYQLSHAIALELENVIVAKNIRVQNSATALNCINFCKKNLYPLCKQVIFVASLCYCWIKRFFTSHKTRPDKVVFSKPFFPSRDID
jgi:hypothetical protein